jgi:hypothetical protein
LGKRERIVSSALTLFSGGGLLAHLLRAFEEYRIEVLFSSKDHGATDGTSFVPSALTLTLSRRERG